MIIRIASRQAFLDTELALLNGGSLKFYSGTRPAALALGSNTLLGTCPLSATAAGATDSSGVATFNAITTDSAPVASGDATFAFACKADGTPILNLSVGTSGTDIIVANISVSSGSGSIAVASATATFPAGA